MGNLKFGDKSTAQLDLVIQSPPSYNFPEKDVEVQHIPGRNGDIIIDKKCYKNVERSYSVASVFKPGTDFISNSEKIIEWLTSQPGYQRLEDSYDPDVYRLAQFKNSGSLTNYYDEATALNITFDCKPQRYLKSGEVKQEYTGNTITINNPTAMTSLPEIELSDFDVDADHILMFTIENYNHDVESMVIISVPNLYDSMIIDSENQVVYNKDGNNITNLSEYVHFNGLDFPTLSKSDNYINIKKYIKNEKYVEKYSTLIDNNQDTAFCLYKPYETLVEIAQDTVDLKSYSQLIENSQEIYDAEAYSSLCMDKSHKIEFESFNDRIQRNSTVINFDSNDFAKPMYGSIPVKRYQMGSTSNPILYQIGDVVSVLIEYKDIIDPSPMQNYRWISAFYKFYVCDNEFVACGTTDDSPERRIATGDLIPFTNRNADYEYHIEGEYAKQSGYFDWNTMQWIDTSVPYPYNKNDIINAGFNACPSQTDPVYYWDKMPQDISLPIISENKQLVIIARLEKNNENDSDYTKTNYSYMFLYPSEFTEIVDPRTIDGEPLKRYGAFIRIIDNDDDKLSMDTIAYINCVDEGSKADILLRSAVPSSTKNSAKIFYNNNEVDNNIINIYPNFKNAIGKGHNCSIILYKAKWAYDSEDDHIGHPELDINIDYDNSIISENVLYNRANKEDLPSMLLNAEDYDPDSSYNKDAYCIHDNFYYKCLEAGTTGTWDSSKWELDLYPIANGDEINSVQYVTKQSGYYYKENKTGIISSIFGSIFNKNGWSHVESDKILESIEWSKKEKEFKYESGLTSTADYSISRSFISDNDIPQYDDIIIEDAYVEDENGNVMTDSAGNKINKTIKARFQISEIDDTIQNILKIMPQYTGFYKIQDSSGNPIGDDSWKACTANVEINVELLKMKASKAYRFLFIDKAPTYQNEENFPEWLDIYPVLYTQNGTIIPENSDLDRLNAYYYDLKVTKTAFYRYYFFDNNIKNRTEWSIINEGNVIGQLAPDSQEYRSVNDVVTINEIDKLEDSDIFPITQFVYMSHEPEDTTDINVYVPIVNLETAQYLLYNSEKVYNKNDLCIRTMVPLEGKLRTFIAIFKCLEDNVTGTWNISKWTKIGIPFIVPDVYDPDKAYTHTDNTSSICLYNKSIYLCIENTTGPWDPTKWTKLGNFIKDFGFYYMAEDSNEEIEYSANIPPNWLVVKVLTGDKADDSDTTLEYYVGNPGTYKWDNNLEWKYMTVEDGLIVASNIKNDTRIYYLENLPAYDADQIYDFNIITSASGNPEHVEIKVKEAGYYKIKTEPNYKYLKVNTTLSKITIYENPDIIRLVDDTGESLDNLKTYITPRWWKL